MAIGQHLLFTLVSVAIGFALGLVLGILLSRRPKLSGVVLPVLSVFNTIPGIVFIGLLVLAWGAGTATVLVALGIYATFPVLKNTYAGLVSVDQQYIEAARGCGMSAIQSLIRVELPLAMPTIIGGLRMSTVYTVSWAVLASMIGGGGLGDFIYSGISSNDNGLILMGAIPPPSWLSCWALWWIWSSVRWSPRGCGREGIRYDRFHDLRAPVSGGRRPHLRRPGGCSPWHPLPLLSCCPEDRPPSGGPDPNHPRLGTAGHHHGVHRSGQAHCHRGSGPLLPAAHRPQHLPGAGPSA